MRSKGFTLVELLAVIAIIAIIAVSAITGVNSVINKQRIKLATVAEEHIKEAALTYFSNKKGTYIEPCVDIDNDYSTIPQYSIKEANDKFRNSLNSSGITSEEAKFAKAKEYTASINNNETIKNQFNEEFLDLKNIGCFKVVTVGELIEKGLMEDNKNMCNKASIIVVYQQGSAKNKAGIATSIQEPQICNGQKIKKQLPVITVNPDSDSTPTPKKTINVAIYDENKKLKKPVKLEYAWSTDRNREPTSGWKALDIDTNKKKGNKNITVKGLSGVNYLWIRSKGTIDSYNNEIMSFPSGPYHFLSVMQLSYNDNGGKDCSSKKKEIVETYLYGQDIDKNNAPLCEPSRTGYDFKGWKFSGADIKNDTVVRETTNHTVTASWDAITVTINLNKNNATNTATDKLTIKYGTNTFNPSTITVPERVYTISFNANSMGATISSLNPKESRYNFDGWNTTASGGKKVINNAATPVLQANVSGYTDENGKWAKTTTTTLYAKWSGGSVSLPTITKTGHTCGWATSSTGNIAYNSGASLTPTGNMTLYAKCTPIAYTVTLNNNGATTPGSASTKVTYLGTKLNAITNPKREYKVSFDLNSTSATATTDQLKATYTLNGWYNNASGESKIATNEATPVLQPNISGYTNASSQWIKTDSTILYAHWTSASVTLPTITKTGNNCSWNTASNGSGTSYNGGASFTPSEDIKLYAKCNAQSYTITLNQNGATTNGSTSTTVVYKATSLGAITNPKREYTVTFNLNSTGATANTDQLKASYTLNGWYKEDTGTTKVASSATTPALQASVSGLTNASKQWTKTDGATLHAKWSSASIKLPSISKTGNTCSWNTKSDGTGTSYNGGATFTPTANTTLYARCGVQSYTITLNQNGATTNGSTSTTVKYLGTTLGAITNPKREYTVSFNKNGTSITATTNPLTATATLKGWYTAKTGGSKIASNATTPALEASVSGYTNASRQWTKNGGETLHAQWALGSVNLPTITSPTGYSCAWNTKSDGTGTAYAGGIIFTPTTNVTLYAKCTAYTYKITLNNNGATTAGTTAIYEKYGTGWYSNAGATTAISAITNPTKTGYTFGGYYTDAGTQIINASGTITVNNTTFSSATTITAYWMPHVLYIKFNGTNTNTLIPKAPKDNKITLTEKEGHSDILVGDSIIVDTEKNVKVTWCGDSSSVYKKSTTNDVLNSNSTTYYLAANYGTSVSLPSNTLTSGICFKSNFYITDADKAWKIGTSIVGQDINYTAESLALAGGCDLATSTSCTITANVNWRKTGFRFNYYCVEGAVEFYGHLAPPYKGKENEICYLPDSYSSWNGGSVQSPPNHRYTRSCDANYTLQKENYIPTKYYFIGSNNSSYKYNELYEMPNTATRAFYIQYNLGTGKYSGGDYFDQLKTKDVDVPLWAEFVAATDDKPYKCVCELCWNYNANYGSVCNNSNKCRKSPKTS